jgi:hypothetical protein
MKFQSRFKSKSARGFKISLLISVLVLVVGGVFLLKSPADAVVRLSRIGVQGRTVSHKLQLDRTDIVYVNCRRGGEPKLGYLSNQLALTCP